MKMIYEHDGVSVTVCSSEGATDITSNKLYIAQRLLTMVLNSVNEELNRRGNYSKQVVEGLIDKFLDDEKEDKDGRNT